MSRTSRACISVVDLFAGPGGLAEGFTAFTPSDRRVFDVRLSIEKDPIACETLTLRRFFHLFSDPPPEYYDYLQGKITREDLFAKYPEVAKSATAAAWRAELGKTGHAAVNERVRTALGSEDRWVLLGGPPCQAYSIVGRSRMRRTHAHFESDERHLLYREYLRIVAHHSPPVFVMENVKGLLSATHGGEGIFQRILNDLEAPGKALRIDGRTRVRYRLHAVGPTARQLEIDAHSKTSDFLLLSEQHGIPQMRHRVFIVGVRSDVSVSPETLELQSTVDAFNVLDDMPPLRSRLSQGEDSPAAWRNAVRAIESQKWLRATNALEPVALEVKKVLRVLKSSNLPFGAPYVPHADRPASLSKWYRRNMSGLVQHETRSHMSEDLHRYLFSACFARIYGTSPRLRDFPTELHPDHANVDDAVNGQMFNDRFRVQLPDRPATTITSHISKDGHYFIHYAPEQCRSFTVREAARIQTFPDNYFFAGNRTQQFHQVGNAVPPLLAHGIANIVQSIFLRWKGG